MSNNSSRSLLLTILVFSLLLTACFSDLNVDIYSRLPSNAPKLLLRCRSKDNDLGYHNLPVNQLYTWSFLENFWGTTLFWCNFWWNGKYVGFHAFDDSMIPAVAHGVDHFKYEARPDGVYYYAPDPDTFDNYQWQLVKKWGYN